MVFRIRLLVPLVLASMVIGGCSSDSPGFVDIDEFMREVRERPEPPIEPLPEFKAYQPFAYSAAGQRSPFEPPAPPRPPRAEGQEDVRPDPDRVEQYLERFPINSLTMVGTLQQDRIFFALIRDPEGGVHRVTTGDYMGQDHGRILEITENAIELDEIVRDGVGGWLKRSRTVQLASAD